MASVPAFSSQFDDVRERRRQIVLADVRSGLLRGERELSPKYFYDERGSELFEEITRLPEYYLTRAERGILLARANEIVESTGARALVELGAGSAAKTRILLSALTTHAADATYVPIDVSEDFLETTARNLSAEYPSLRVEPVVGDIEDELSLPAALPSPVLFAFLGSTIGNFESAAATHLLRRVRRRMRPQDRLLLGTDLRKDAATLNAAYNDSRGVTAEFNRNMLRVLNAELGADFAPDRFAHRAFYNENEYRIEMHLDAIGDQIVHVPGLPTVVIRDGEGIRTEVSHKYDRASVDYLARAAGLSIERWFTDAENRFALSLLRPA